MNTELLAKFVFNYELSQSKKKKIPAKVKQENPLFEDRKLEDIQVAMNDRNK